MASCNAIGLPLTFLAESVMNLPAFVRMKSVSPLVFIFWERQRAWVSEGQRERIPRRLHTSHAGAPHLWSWKLLLLGIKFWLPAFSFSAWKTWLCCCQAYISNEKSALIGIFVQCVCFSVIFLFLLVLNNVTCFFTFLVLRVCWASWICVFIVFILFEKTSSHCFFRYVCSCVLLWECQWHMYVYGCLKSHSSLVLFSFSRMTFCLWFVLNSFRANVLSKVHHSLPLPCLTCS